MAILFIYSETAHFGFVNYDDNLYVSQNQMVLSGVNRQSIVWASTAVVDSNWLPLTLISHMLDVSIYGSNIGGHHITNIMLHTLNVILLFVIVQLMTGNLIVSALTAALFAVHPVHVESVAWISERKDVLSTFFWMLALLSYLLYASKPRIVRHLCALCFFMLSLMSKPMAVTFPFVLLLFDFWPLKRFNFTHSTNEGKSAAWLIAEKIPFFIFSAILSFITYRIQIGSEEPFEAIPLVLRLKNALISYVKYIYMMVYPHGLSPLYPLQKAIPLSYVLLSVVLIAAVTIVSIKFVKKSPWLLVGWLFYLGTLFPVAGVVQIGLHSMADRYTYVPYIGLFLMLAMSLPKPKTRNQTSILISILLIVIIILSITSKKQVHYWKDDFTLFGRAAQVTKDNYVALYNIGTAYAIKGNFSLSKQYFNEAIRINPDYVHSYINLAYVLFNENRTADAIYFYSEAIKKNPLLYTALNGIGMAYMAEGKAVDAKRSFVMALNLNPYFSIARENLRDAETMRNKNEKH
ncbi:tetratricopeptide repeat protein [Candidatus Magnetomonas plexicatena]|uniref:tetratricopeptide repeat protein n=1 Tax=Candidatus Magnetomonas plexicatena TaxID=2552947 RepID=UPI001C74E3E7|nr:tetratricopeptide repeat protein [Nitrospirales bacterium LBB_01]